MEISDDSFDSDLLFASGSQDQITQDHQGNGDEYLSDENNTREMKSLCDQNILLHASKPSFDQVELESLTLRWSKPERDPSTVTGYIIQSREISETGWKDVTSNCKHETIAIEGLTPDTSYQFRVCAYSIDEIGTFSAPSDIARTLSNAPTKPVPAIILNNSIEIKWWSPRPKTKTIEGHEINYRLSSSSRWNVLHSEISEERFEVKNLERHKGYVFRIRTLYNEGESTYSEESCVIETKSKSPGKPKFCSSSRHSITISWTKPDDETSQIVRYTIFYKKHRSSSWRTYIGIKIMPSGVCLTEVRSLESNTDYVFKVQALFADGTKTNSEESIPIRTDPGPTSIPLRYDVSPNSITIGWRKPEGDSLNLERYEIQYRRQDNGDWKTKPGVIQNKKYTVLDLKDGTAYIFRVNAIYSDFTVVPSKESDVIWTQIIQPSVPKILYKTAHSVFLRWQNPTETTKFIRKHSIYYKDCKKQNWSKTTVDKVSETANIVCLESDTEYQFMVCNHYGSSINTKANSPKSDPVCTFRCVAAKVIADNSLQEIENPKCGNLKIYQLPLRIQVYNRENKIQKCVFGSYNPGKPEKTILMVGASGSGKSMMIESMINYILDVEWRNNFRVKIVKLSDAEKERVDDQTVSQTEWITVYRIEKMAGSNVDFTINIVDTPGFQDTKGIHRDMEITEQIKALFSTGGEEGICTIDVICLVVKSHDVRLTQPQRHVFGSMLSIFGHDIRDNLVVFSTFSDGGTPLVLKALKEQEIPCEHTYRFNNVALFERDEKLTVSWNMCRESFIAFFEKLSRMKSKSLQLTNLVLEKRAKIEAIVNGLQETINKRLNNISTLEQEEELLHKLEHIIEENKDFEYYVTETEKVEVEIETGGRATNCDNCQMTCHYPCVFTPKVLHWTCAVMKNGKCMICDDNCAAFNHKMSKTRYVTLDKQVRRTFANLQTRYQIAKEEAKQKELSLDALRREKQRKEKEVIALCSDAAELIEELNKIAMKPDPLHNVQYIEYIIELEKQEKDEGYEKRVKLLENLKTKAEVLELCSTGKMNKLLETTV